MVFCAQTMTVWMRAETAPSAQPDSSTNAERSGTASPVTGMRAKPSREVTVSMTRESSRMLQRGAMMPVRTISMAKSSAQPRVIISPLLPSRLMPVPPESRMTPAKARERLMKARRDGRRFLISQSRRGTRGT